MHRLLSYGGSAPCHGLFPRVEKPPLLPLVELGNRDLNPSNPARISRKSDSKPEKNHREILALTPSSQISTHGRFVSYSPPDRGARDRNRDPAGMPPRLDEMTMTNKAGRILQRIKERDRKNLKRWKPYTGPADWSFIVLDAPQQPIEGERDERPQVSNG